MQSMRIGDSVMVSATRSVEYDKDLNKRVYVNKCKPFKAVITGKRIKALGKLIHNVNNGYFDYDPPSLKVMETIELWEIRSGLLNKPLLADIDDMVDIAPFNLPRRSLRPEYTE